uniref:DUF2628 domain-containing protein n=2 Tax=Bursaphelenchus xylophilus TaxID=6326 RepID=A0A1I7SN12_BURXY
MPDEEFYVDHGKKVDKDGKLILEVDDKPWLLNAIFDFKTYAVFFLWSLLFENLLRVYVRTSFYTIACGIAGLYVGFKVWKSEVHKRRDIILAIGYA